MAKKIQNQSKTQNKGGHRRPHHPRPRHRRPKPAKVWIACNIL